ncbi:hypothetical protein HMPREF9374_0552 [Desmospora sp. 8437]|nr:hypothetical protein HMPREF9374_0552 [Desmospora sp. 8437]
MWPNPIPQITLPHNIHFSQSFRSIPGGIPFNGGSYKNPAFKNGYDSALNEVQMVSYSIRFFISFFISKP